MDELDHHLAGGDRLGDSRSGGLFLHPLDEVARDRQRDVGLQQGHAHLAQGGDDIGLGQRTGPGQAVEDATKAF
ncbi:hypothetical protein MASR1M32_41480 [Rhodobacter sp.]